MARAWQLRTKPCWHLVGFQREVLVHHHLAAQHLGAAGTAHAGLAREGQVEAGVEGRVEHVFVGADVQFVLLAVEHDGQRDVLGGGLRLAAESVSA